MVDVTRNRDAQFPIAIKLNSGMNKLTLKAANELYAKLGQSLCQPEPDRSVMELMRDSVAASTRFQDWSGSKNEVDAKKKIHIIGEDDVEGETDDD